MGVYLILQVSIPILTRTEVLLRDANKWVQKVNLPLQVQPQIFGTFSAIIWAQILHYGQYVPSLVGYRAWKCSDNDNSGYTSMKATVICCALLLLLGGLEALLILTLRVCPPRIELKSLQVNANIIQIPYNKGITWPDLLVGIVATIMLGAGVIPAYFELWKRNGRVVGFSKFLSLLEILDVQLM